MNRLWLTIALISSGAAVCGAAEFAPPVRLKAEGAAIRVDSPGMAAPGWADLKRDGSNYLLVGQFDDGKIRSYKHLGGDKFAAGNWVMAGDKPAEVPGVW